MKNLLAPFISDGSGVPSIEYGLVAALVAVVMIAALVIFRTNLTSVLTSITQFAAVLAIAS